MANDQIMLLVKCHNKILRVSSYVVRPFKTHPKLLKHAKIQQKGRNTNLPFKKLGSLDTPSGKQVGSSCSDG